MKNCSVVDNLEIVEARAEDYRRLGQWHYRRDKPGAWSHMYALKPRARLRPFVDTAGVIMYTMPAPAVALRDVALGGMLKHLSRRDRLAIINKNIRCISRVIIEPRFRGLGLASMLVGETLARCGSAVVEAMAVMGRVNPFFERAGMRAYHGPPPARVERMKEALSVAGIEQSRYADVEAVHQKISRLSRGLQLFIDREMSIFLQSYGPKRSLMPAVKERTRYMLSKLTDRPIYYIWFNPDKTIEI